MPYLTDEKYKETIITAYNSGAKNALKYTVQFVEQYPSITLDELIGQMKGEVAVMETNEIIKHDKVSFNG